MLRHPMTITACIYLWFCVTFSHDIVTVTFDIFILTLLRTLRLVLNIHLCGGPKNVSHYHMITKSY